ncbi:MAG: fibrillin [Synechococcales cyanobacterium RU_4_20]|nr:fibrillin [Synechococcales cyanobacterium RU_4_20]NJR68246.1 fibrillin [Synechococcales cyanobacterium CRU_2_2]
MLGKSKLLELLASTNRGIAGDSEQRAAILSQVAQLEARNPTAGSTQSAEQLDGDWQLLYTTSTELLGIDRIPLLKLGQIYQCLRLNTGRAYNLAEVEGLPYCEGLVSIAARFALEGDPAKLARGDRRIKVQFERAIFGLQRWVGYESPQQFIRKIESGERFAAIDFSIQGRQGWIDLTYLDDDLRINRGSRGSLFVLKRV